MIYDTVNLQGLLFRNLGLFGKLRPILKSTHNLLDHSFDLGLGCNITGLLGICFLRKVVESIMRGGDRGLIFEILSMEFMWDREPGCGHRREVFRLVAKRGFGHTVWNHPLLVSFPD